MNLIPIPPQQQVLYNVMYEAGANFTLVAANGGAIAVQYAGKPLWLYVDENMARDEVRAFFCQCLEAINKPSGLITSKQAAKICADVITPVTSWELEAYYLDVLLAPKQLQNPSPEDATLLASWLTAFYKEALLADYKPNQQVVQALINSQRLHIIKTKASATCAMGMYIPITTNYARMGRLNLIYCPPLYRGLGYAKQITAALAYKLQQQGQLPVLYVRANNTKAVNLYRGLGFKLAGELTELRF